MNSISMRDYKHDISGKFRDITTAINSLEMPISEVFHAVHEVLLKMVKTSRKTMLEVLEQKQVLIITDAIPDETLPILHIEGVKVRWMHSEDQVSYFLFLSENARHPYYLIGKLHALLPIKEQLLEVRNNELRILLESLS